MRVITIVILIEYVLLFFNASFLHNSIPTPFSSNKEIHEAYLKPQTDSIMIENWSFMILFESNRHMTDTFSDQKIEELKNILDQYPAFSIRLEARTDSVGSPQYNLALANRRLNFVRNEFIKRGIEEDRFIEFVLGEEEPLADNNSPEGRQANRSVRVVVGLYSPIQMISGRFVSDEDGRGIGGILYTGSRHHRDAFQIDSSGNFSFPVPVVDNIFSMEFFSKEDRILRKTFFDLNRINPSFFTIPLKVLQTGETLTFEDILFEGNKTTLVPGSEQALKRLLNLIAYAENYRFEIQGHINLPTPKTLRKFKGHSISDARAKTIYYHLIEHGIDSNRLEWKGYGNWFMVFPDPQTEIQARQNRRVSVKSTGTNR